MLLSGPLTSADLNHCGPQQSAADLEALAKLLQYGTIWHLVAGRPHDLMHLCAACLGMLAEHQG